MENRQPKGSQCSEIRFLKIQDGGRPPSWISILGQRLPVFSVRSIAGSSIQSMMNDPQKGAWPRSRDLLLKQWDRYPRSTERISCLLLQAAAYSILGKFVEQLRKKLSCNSSKENVCQFVLYRVLKPVSRYVRKFLTSNYQVIRYY